MNRVLSIEQGVIIEKIGNFAPCKLSGYVTERAKPCIAENNLTHFIPVSGI